MKRCALNRLKALTIFLLGMHAFNMQGSIFEKSSEMTWHMDYKEAAEESMRTQLPLLVVFLGSDWHASCMKAYKEVFSSSAFSQQVRDTFVCLGVDFPKYSQQSEDIRIQNYELKSKFQIDELPSLLILSSEGRKIYATSSFGSETGESLGKHLLHVLDSDTKISQAMLNISELSMDDLQNYYRLSEEVVRKDFMEAALEVGVQKEDYFFLSEAYRILVESGAMDSEECQRIKHKLLGQDPHNAKYTHFTVALVEFQELAKRAQSDIYQDVSQVIAPLESYLSQFGQTDMENVWKIEMMIAQFYLDSDQWKSALEHAEVAFETAPKEMRSEIARSLDYIRHQA